jgi:hypothetical protein
MNYQALVQSIAALHAQSVGRAVTAINQALVLRNWAIGAYIIEFEQNGEDRAKYGQGLLRRLSSDLSACRLKGVSPDMLERMRLFVRHYPQMADAVSAPPARISTLQIEPVPHGISAPVRKSAVDEPKPLSPEKILRLSWTHLSDLARIDDPWKRAFYEIECLNGNWSKRQLQRQIGSLLYERTALSTDKAAVIERARQESTETASPMADLIRDPYVLEFVGLAERPSYTENQYEYVEGKNHGRPEKGGSLWDMQLEAGGLEKQLDELISRWHHYMQQRWVELSQAFVQADPVVFMKDIQQNNELHRNFIFNNETTLISDWLRNRNTVEFLGVWERIHNPDFNSGEFATIKSSAWLNNYKISVKEWVTKTHNPLSRNDSQEN